MVTTMELLDIVNDLERKRGMLTIQELLDIVNDLKRKIGSLLLDDPETYEKYTLDDLLKKLDKLHGKLIGGMLKENDAKYTEQTKKLEAVITKTKEDLEEAETRAQQLKVMGEAISDIADIITIAAVIA